jgi:hypothetical protein
MEPQQGMLRVVVGVCARAAENKLQKFNLIIDNNKIRGFIDG